PWLEGNNRFVVASRAPKTPIADAEDLPTLPESLSPASGSATVRVNTAWIGVLKRSAPSRKNGRFSGKNSANRVFTSSWATSASTWEKSGFPVALSVRLELMPHRKSRPKEGSTLPFASGPSGSWARTSVRLAVTAGSNSMFRPGAIPWKPVTLFASHRSEEHTSELQSRGHLVCRLLLEKKKKTLKFSGVGMSLSETCIV